MPKTQTNTQRKSKYEMIARAEGEQCIVCHIEHFVRRSRPAGKLEIDHADNNETNWNWSNLHLVCHKHNCVLREMSPRRHISLLREYSSQVEKERERENLPTRKTLLKDMIPYQDGSPEMKANRTYEKVWLTEAHRTVREGNGSAFKKDVISNGAARSGCSIQVSQYNYLVKYTAPISVFRETEDEDGNKIIVYRELKVGLHSPISKATNSKKTLTQLDGVVHQE